MPDENLDVNTEADSSTATSTGTETAGDVAVDSSSTKVAETAGDTAPKTMAEAIKQSFDKSKAEASQATDEAKPEGSDVQKVDKTDKAGEKKVGDKEESTDGEKTTDKVEDKGPVPLERFQEVVKARQEIERTLEEVKPLADQHRKNVEYCQQAGITPEQYREALEVQALINSNPAEALKRLSAVVDALQGVTGGKLPADLQGEVDAGDLPLARAKEIAQLRAQQQHGQRYAQAAQRSVQQQQAQRTQEMLLNSAQTWEAEKRKTDPDYRPRKDKSEPLGKFEMTQACFLQKLHAQDERGQFVNPATTPAQMTALLEEAYQEVNATFRAQRPKPPAKSALTHKNSSTNPPKSYEQAKTLKEAVEMAVANHR